MERGKNGKFAKGNSGGPGRPPIATERRYLRTLSESCTVDDWKEIAERAVADAKQGDSKAREWLSTWLLGRPNGQAPTLTELVTNDAAGVGDDHVNNWDVMMAGL